MKLTSLLPLGSMFFRHWHTDDSEIGIGVAKAAFTIDPDGGLRTVRPAPELQLEDIYEGDPALTPMLSEQDTAPGKTGTDIVIHADAHSPGGRDLADWQVGVSIPERLTYQFMVRGPSRWEHGLLGWKLSEPALVNRVPLTYALAYGGPAGGWAEVPKDNPVYQRNPAGKGYATEDSLKGKQPFAAPQIGDIGDFMGAQAGQEMMVHGVGPIGKAWLPRRAHAGTFDQDWIDTRHPRMPRDYELDFWNNAHPRLQLRPYLTGNEVITLHGMVPGGGDRAIKLPGIKMMLAATGDNVSKNHTMKLDTVVIDVRDPNPEAHSLNLVWRALVTGPARFDAGTLQSVKLE